MATEEIGAGDKKNKRGQERAGSEGVRKVAYRSEQKTTLTFHDITRGLEVKNHWEGGVPSDGLPA